MLPLFVALLGLAAPVDVPMRIVNDHVFVDVWLNGRGPFNFIVDSGAGNYLDPSVAARLGVRVSGNVVLSGVGATTQRAGRTNVRAVRIGSATFASERFVVAPSRTMLSAAEGPLVDGLIGREIVGAGVTVFDYAHRRLTFGAANAVVKANGATVLALRSHMELPQVRCNIGSIAATCTLDTGSRLAVTILAAFAQRHRGVVPATSARGIDGFGIGGAAYGRLGYLSRLRLGTSVLTHVPADWSTQRRGVFADRSTAANIGGGVLRRFIVAFDIPHGRVGLRPNGDTEPYDVDRSGTFVVGRDNGIVIADVRARTPAARAGLRRGDRITAADRRVYRAGELPALRARLQAPAGTVVRLDIARAGMKRTVALRLADYF